jgi:hypothetical protein
LKFTRRGLHRDSKDEKQSQRRAFNLVTRMVSREQPTASKGQPRAQLNVAPAVRPFQLNRLRQLISRCNFGRRHKAELMDRKPSLCVSIQRIERRRPVILQSTLVVQQPPTTVFVREFSDPQNVLRPCR